ncbi:MAG: hypothetical protein HYZ53_10150 [Planctomycetes bacterium]|nr:hypothetical protein [Planctomycetota bacterium]
MSTERREGEFQDLRARAIWVLEHAESAAASPRLATRQARLRLWHYGSFRAEDASWTLFVPGPRAPEDVEPIIRRVTWERAADRRRLLSDPLEGLKRGFHVRPTIHVVDADVPEAELAPILEAGASLPVGAVSLRESFVHWIALDGDRYGFESSGGTPGIRLEWHDAGPSEWSEFTAWVARLRSLFADYLAWGEAAPEDGPA